MAVLTARQRQLRDGWIAMLDRDLPLAQEMLRLPPARWPVPPIAVPAVTTEDWDGSLVELVAAIPPPTADEPAPVARPTAEPRGAYARRARKAAP